MSNVNDAFEQFRDALVSFGLEVDTLVTDGDCHRAHVIGDRRKSKNGWYALHLNGPDIWGAYGSWKTGEKFGWRYRKTSTEIALRSATKIGTVITPPRRPIDLAAYWDAAVPANPHHPYLVRKRVPPIGIRQRADSLLIPLRNERDDLVGIQSIGSFGLKRFVRGSKPGGAFYLLDRPGNILLVVEGYADGASCHTVSGLPVAIAFGAGNLMAVGLRLTLTYPLSRLVFVADDDSDAPRNIGLIKATEAADACNGAVISAAMLKEGV